MKPPHLFFLVILVSVFFFTCCVERQDAENTTVTSMDVTSTTLADIPADVSISSFTCSLTPIADGGGNKLDQVRAVVRGKAQGPVGARLELPILIWSTAEWDCGAWAHKKGALIAVGHTCVREEGQPDAMNWSVTAAGKVTSGSMKGSRSYGAKIYLDTDIMPQNEDSKDTSCQ